MRENVDFCDNPRDVIYESIMARPRYALDTASRLCRTSKKCNERICENVDFWKRYSGRCIKNRNVPSTDNVNEWKKWVKNNTNLNLRTLSNNLIFNVSKAHIIHDIIYYIDKFNDFYISYANGNKNYLNNVKDFKNIDEYHILYLTLDGQLRYFERNGVDKLLLDNIKKFDFLKDNYINIAYITNNNLLGITIYDTMNKMSEKEIDNDVLMMNFISKTNNLVYVKKDEIHIHDINTDIIDTITEDINKYGKYFKNITGKNQNIYLLNDYGELYNIFQDENTWIINKISDDVENIDKDIMIKNGIPYKIKDSQFKELQYHKEDKGKIKWHDGQYIYLTRKNNWIC